MFKIALDAGHGKYTAGKRCMKAIDKNETREWWLNDRICDKIEKRLAAYSGYSLIRVDDSTGETDVTLSNRVSKANNYAADFYLSVHHNAGINGGSGGGIVAIVDTIASGKSKEYQQIIYDELIEKTGLKGNRSIPLAQQNLYVCKHTKMPAVLVELGFMDSTTDVPIILTENFADKAAEGLVNALVKIGNLTLSTTNSEEATKDNTPDAYAEEAIKWAIDNGILYGDGNGNYKLHSNISRQDMLVFLYRAKK